MSYNKQNFANGQVLNASHLNYIENGIIDLENTVKELKDNNDNGNGNSNLYVELDVTWIDGVYISRYGDDKGSAVTLADYSATDYIDVSNINSVRIRTHISGDAPCIAFYKKDKTLVDCYKPESTVTHNYDVPNGASYMRVSCSTSYLNKVFVVGYEMFDNYNTVVELYDASKNSSSTQYYNIAGEIVKAPGWYTTKDMDVSGAHFLIYGGLDKTADGASPRSVFKDIFGNVIKTFKPAKDENILKIPVGAASVSFTLHYEYDIDDFYLKSICHNWSNDTILTTPYRLSRAHTLLNKATQKKICCIVDDDTVNVESVQLLKDACDANNIKATMACLTTNIERESNAGLTEKLLEMEQNGFQVVIHAHTQTGYEDDIWRNPETNKAECEADLVQGLQKMEAAGFTDYKYWVTPYCKDGEAVQRMARKWGMNCILAGGNAYEPADDTYGRFAIRRAAFGISDNKADSSITLAELQAIAQEAANNNGWLVIMTHFEQWQKADVGYTRFTDLITYLEGLGFEFMTVAEAWSYRRAIYDVYDMF